ncbi:MAG: transketolase C-terminal domain-containing protein [Patescibacteria group bacterium]
MINSEQKLNPKLFDKDIERVSMRAGFGEGLVKAAEKDNRVVGLCADLAESVQMQAFKEKFPDRFIEVGVAEQNLVTVASGMAAMGKIPFVGSYAVFSPGRNWEQIRTTICYNNQPVKIVGSHAGLNVGADGGSHQALEDIALMRVLPRMVVISPCDAIETKKAIIAMAKTDSPTYIRLAREKSAVITTEETPFEIGKAQIVYKSNGKLDVGIIATGAMLYRALFVAKRLEEEGKKVAVMNLSTIKPLDEDAIIKLAHEARALVTIEEHQIAGGMGSAVAECLAKHFPIPIEFIGVKDLFGQSGTPKELFEHYGMGEKDVYEAVKRVMLRK